MAAVPMLAGVGLLMVCCSSLSAFTMMGDDDDKKKKKDDDSDSDVPKTPEQIKADEAKAALDTLKADPDATPDEITAAQTAADNAQTAAGEGAAPDPPPPSDSYRIEVGIDYPGSDIFYYSPDGDIKATKDVCLDKCTDLPACKLVTFNNAETLCWGKSVAENKRDHGNRNNYFKN